MKTNSWISGVLRGRGRGYFCAGAAVLGAAGIFSVWPGEKARPDGEKAAVVEPAGTALSTEVEEVTVSEFTPEVVSEGTVLACDTVSLTAQVGGTVKRIAQCFEGSAFIPAGEVVVELDGADFEGAIVSARAQLARAQSALALEETRSRQARQNWEELGYKDEPGELVLRLPQLSEARAAMEAAGAALARAQRDLERTKIRVPFACRVLTRTVAPGQTVNNGAVLGTIMAAGKAFVRLPIPQQNASLLPLPETATDKPLDIELRMGAESAVRLARIVRTEPRLDEETGSLIATAEVMQPYARVGEFPPLRIGQKVSATIRGAGVKDVMALPREAVAEGNLVHLISRESSRLMRKTVTPLWMDEEKVIIRGLPRGSLLATGGGPELDEAPDGALVKIVADRGR